MEERPQREQEEAKVLLQDCGGAEGQRQGQQEAHSPSEGAVSGQGRRVSHPSPVHPLSHCLRNRLLVCGSDCVSVNLWVCLCPGSSITLLT